MKKHMRKFYSLWLRPFPALILCAVALRGGAALPDLMIYGPATIPHVVYYTFDANDCTVKEGCVPAGTRRLLAFDTQTRNMGQADLIMGNPATNSLFVFDPCHNHYHFIGFAEYRLRDTNSNLVVLGKKIGFCLEDIVQWDPNVSTNRIYDCNYQGIQKGWADLYVEQVPCQWLDITGLPSGDYVVEMEINPLRNIVESDYSNNITQVPVFIPPDCTTSATPNDQFSNAQVIQAIPTRVTGDNVCATKEAGEPDHAGNPGGHSVWYQLTSSSNTLIRVSTVGSDFDTLLAVYTGSSVDHLSLVASNDDIIEDQIIQSSLSFQAVAATRYYIAVDGFDGAVGGVVLNINPPLNDDFSNCQQLTGAAGRANGYNIGATKEAGEPDHNSDFGGHSVWYCWTAPASGMVLFDTIGSSFDTLLAVYTGDTVDSLTSIASDNDSGGNLTSRVVFDASEGQVYQIAIDGVSGATGNLVLNWGPPVHLTIGQVSASSVAVTLTGSPGTYSIQGSTNLANWNTLTTLSLGGSSQQYTDNAPGTLSRRFYRALLVR